MAAWVAALALGYVLGSVPWGLLLTRAAGHGDIRAIGSGNIGATNVLRTVNKKLAAATLVGDMLKGTAAVLVAWHWLGGPQAALAAAVGAFLGHLFPVWLGFKGGKGVATYIGVMLGLYWPAALIFCLAWLAAAFSSRYSSFAALTASAITPIFLWWITKSAQLGLLAMVLTILLWFMHRENIKRLLNGTEGKIGQK